MDISQYQNMYESILKNLGNNMLYITRDKAYEIYKTSNINYPFLEDKLKFGKEEYTKKEYDEAVEHSKNLLADYKKDISDKSQDWGLFQLKYYNEKTDRFEIPMKEIIKNYFLCYQTNISHYRGMDSGNWKNQMQTLQVYEYLLKSARDSVVNLLAKEVGLDPKIVNALDEKDNQNAFYDLYWYTEASNKAKEAKRVLDVLIKNEEESLDYKNMKRRKADENFEVLYKENFSKQMFIDLVEKEYGNNPIVKKAVSHYINAQSDRAFLAQLENIFSNYTKNENGLYAFDDLKTGNSATLSKAISDLLK